MSWRPLDAARGRQLRLTEAEPSSTIVLQGQGAAENESKAAGWAGSQGKAPTKCYRGHGRPKRAARTRLTQERLRDFRDSRGLTQAAVAEALEMPRVALVFVERLVVPVTDEFMGRYRAACERLGGEGKVSGREGGKQSDVRPVAARRVGALRRPTSRSSDGR